MEVKTNKNVFSGNNEDAKVIRSAKIARQLLQKGGESVRIIDVKPNKTDSNKTVFIFRNDDNFQKCFNEVLSENQESRNKNNFDDRVKKEVEARVKEEMEKYMAQMKEVGGSVNV